tara:strand:- start:457 stop:831 length:375 start_codon:yes stop_codon:yes gene_type:complete
MTAARIITAAEASAAASFLPDTKVHTGVLVDAPGAQLVWAKFEPGGLYGLHAHSHDQLSVVVSGRLLLTLGEETREVGPGDMWFAPAGVRHGGDILGDEPCVFIDIYVPPSKTIHSYIDGNKAD